MEAETLGEAMVASFMANREKFVATWLAECGLSPLDVVVCETTVVESNGSVTTRIHFERKH